MKNENLNKNILSGLKAFLNAFLNKMKLIRKHKLSLLEIFILLLLVVFVSFFAGYIYNDKKAVFKDKQLSDKNIEKFIENYNYVIDNYYKDINKEELIDGAIAGMMESLGDPYSVYLDSDTSNNMNITLNGSYKGIGVAVSNSEDNYIKVVAILKDSPASKADIKEGDIIKKINNINTHNMSISDFSDLVLSNKDNDYELEILRDGEEIKKVVEKQKVVIDSVSSKIIEKNNKKIGYIYISVFASNTDKQFMKSLNELETSKIDALIIDVRNNTGGHLNSVEKILKQFLTKQQIVYQMKKDNEITKTYGSAKANKDYEIVVVGNHYSASASEILISGLKENLKSKYIGEKSYGKGTVQEIVTLSNNKQYKITTKKWLTPKGNFVGDTSGIIPDIEIELENNDTDLQLDRALDYLLQAN